MGQIMWSYFFFNSWEMKIQYFAIFVEMIFDFFIRPFYKMMLGKSIELKDMESVDTGDELLTTKSVKV